MNAETPLYDKAIGWANAQGFNAWRHASGGRRDVRCGKKGLPDVMGYHVRTGQALYVECKHEASTTPLTDDQYLFLLNARIGGCFVRVFTDKLAYELHQVPQKLLPRTRREG